MGIEAKLYPGMNAAILTDRPELDQGKHNYLKAMEWLRANGKLSGKLGVLHTEVVHSDWCNVFDGHLCNCRPDILANGKLLKYPAKALGDTYFGNAKGQGGRE